MSLLYFAGGLALGFVLGVGGALFYLKWKMQKQLGSIQDQMNAVMDLSGELNEAAGFPVEDSLETDADKEESEENKEE